MDEFTSVALWLMIALMSINGVFTWLTLNETVNPDGFQMGLKVAPSSIFANQSSCNYFLDKNSINSVSGNTVTESNPQTSEKSNQDFSKAYSCTADTLWTMAGGWVIVLGNVFDGGIFGDSTNPTSLGYLFLNLVLPLFIIAQVIAFLLILYRVLVAGKGLFGFLGI